MFQIVLLGCYYREMVRLLKINIGKNQADEGVLREIFLQFPGQWLVKLIKGILVLDKYTYVVFYTDNVTFNLLKHIYTDINGVEKEKPEELTQAEIAEAIES